MAPATDKELRFELTKTKAFTIADFAKLLKSGAGTIACGGEEAVVMTSEAFSGLKRAFASDEFKTMLSDALSQVEPRPPKHR